MSGFKNLRKKVRRRRLETILLAGYAFAVTCALFLSLLNKPTELHPRLPIYHISDENFDFNADVLTPAFNDSAQNNPFEQVYAQVNDIKLLSDNEIVVQKFQLSQNEQKELLMPIDSKPKYVKEEQFSGVYQKERHVLVVKSGDTFIGMLTNLGMDTKTATEAYNVFKKVFDARTLRVGQFMELSATFDIQSKQLEALDTLVFEPERGTKYILRVNEYDKFEALVEREKFAHDVKIAKGTIRGQTLTSLINSGVPRRLANEVIQRFSHLINFRSGVHNGDTFSLKYDVSKAANGDVVKVGNLLFASFTIGKQTYKLYRFNDEYYDEKGGAKKTGLDIKPLAMRNARISSLFGYRRHPIYKTQKFHNGVDYAAPKGTAIFASGNGVVEMARYVNGYGNFVKIRHNSEYETAYGHMQKFAAGIRAGVRVRKGQIIGYVGSTGRSTGPHLHFEILRKGQRINPLKAKVATGNDLTGARLNEFKRRVRQIDGATEQIAKKEIKLAPAPKLEIAEENMLDSDLAGAEGKIAAETEVSSADAKSDATATENALIMPPIEENTTSAAAENITLAVWQKMVSSINESGVKVLEPTEGKNTDSQQEEVAEGIKEKSAEQYIGETAVSDAAYKGKIIYPQIISAATIRQRHFLKNHKIVRVPPRKPKYARR